MVISVYNHGYICLQTWLYLYTTIVIFLTNLNIRISPQNFVQKCVFIKRNKQDSAFNIFSTLEITGSRNEESGVNSECVWR